MNSASLASEFRNVLLRLRTVYEIRKGCELVSKFARIAKMPVLLLQHASHPVFNCISFPPLFLCFSIDFRAC